MLLNYFRMLLDFCGTSGERKAVTLQHSQQVDPHRATNSSSSAVDGSPKE